MNNPAPKVNPDIELPPAPSTGGELVDVSKATSMAERNLRPPQNEWELIQQAMLDPRFDEKKFGVLMDWRKQEERSRQEEAFNLSMHAAQAKMSPIAADMTNNQTKSKYASYAKLDREIRKFYIDAGLAISFNTGKTDTPNHVRVLADVSFGKFTKTFHIDMPIVTTGFKGTEMMTLTHATISATTYAKRNLLAMIFNLAVDPDDDGNKAGGKPISHAQVEQMQKYIVKVGADIKLFCEFLGVDDIESIPADKFNHAMKQLDMKAAAEKKKAAKEKA